MPQLFILSVGGSSEKVNEQNPHFNIKIHELSVEENHVMAIARNLG